MPRPTASPPPRPAWAQVARAPYATDPLQSRGRLHDEPESASRSPFQRDRDRIIHASAFRRLKQKTQVFIAHEGDHYRTRLTHSLEVAQIARSVARTLGLDEDLAEAVALAHDLGHPPFGHSGEDELDACMKGFGGFDHNAQTLRVLTKLELRYPAWDGLNLAWETLEGVVKHNGPLVKPGTTLDDLPTAIREYAREQDLELDTWAGPEAQVAALADDVAYNNHDIDDGLRAGLFRIEDLLELPFVGDVFRAVKADYPSVDADRWGAEGVRRLIGARIDDLVRETQKRAARLGPTSAADVRALKGPLVAFSDEMKEHEAALRRFLFDRMYRHYQISRVRSQARRILRDLFEIFLREPELLPDRWRIQAVAPGTTETARVVCDYIAGMTDPFAIDEHRRLFNLDRWR
ncbi:MAG: deoxyguanosinetriphosphate triphosphohydrolase [Alphaproteobacteria bacterium]|nr:deoxyguanosinetriphosphate triphosphohydrolase [Alphaproteobacteria bacterium]